MAQKGFIRFLVAEGYCYYRYCHYYWRYDWHYYCPLLRLKGDYRAENVQGAAEKKVVE